MIKRQDARRTPPYVREVVKLSDHVMPVIGTCESMFTLNLRAEVPKDQHSWVVLTQKY